MKQSRTRINEFIAVPNVFLIDEKGTSLGVFPTKQAFQMAQDKQLDLVEVSPQARPPVCKLLDYGKYKYELNKRGKSQKKKQGLKEIRMQPKISEHDLGFKTNHIQQFLQEGNKVKVTIRFRGRELSHTELGEDVLRDILERLECPYTVDKQPSMEGRNMTMLLSPTGKKSEKKKNTDEQSQSTPKDESIQQSTEQATDNTVQ